MLTVYAATWCPHCQKAEKWLKENGVPFTLVDIETAPEAVVARVVAANGGDDWVVPTLEFEGKWREGKVFHAEEFAADLKRMGVF